MYGEGISKTGELVDLGVKAGIVEKSGSWFSFDSERIGQGRENAKQFLKEHPQMAEKIERAIRQNAGLIAGQILQGTAETDEDGSAEEAPGFAEDGAAAPLGGTPAKRGRRGA
jgi:recombination protein RecA